MWRSPDRSTVIALIVASAMFMESLDSTVISTSLPAIAVSFSASPVDLSLGITIYLLSLAIFIPVSGWVTDRLGGRTTFCAAIAVFTVGSILCGASTGLISFASARFLQGIGGAMMVPVGRLVLVRAVTAPELINAFAYMTVPAMFAPMIGAPLGGFITTYLSWRWIFWLNVPIGVLGILAAITQITKADEIVRRPLDWQGFVWMSISVSCLIFGLELAAHDDGNRTRDLILFAVALITGWRGVVHALGHPHPLVDLSLLRIPTYAASALGGALYRVACGALPLVLPLVLQIGLGMTAFSAGLFVLAGAVGGLGMKTTATPILRRFGFRSVLIVNGLISAVSMLLCSLIAPGIPSLLLFVLLLAGGFFRSLEFTALMAIAWADIPPARASAATSLFGLLQQISFSAGVAFGALLLRATTAHAGAPPAFATAFIGIGGLALLNTINFVRLDRGAGATVSGHAGRSAMAPAIGE